MIELLVVVETGSPELAREEVVGMIEVVAPIEPATVDEGEATDAVEEAEETFEVVAEGAVVAVVDFGEAVLDPEDGVAAVELNAAAVDKEDFEPAVVNPVVPGLRVVADELEEVGPAVVAAVEVEAVVVAEEVEAVVAAVEVEAVVAAVEDVATVVVVLIVLVLRAAHTAVVGRTEYSQDFT